MNTATDRKTVARERRALVKRQFSLADAIYMICRRLRSAHQVPCPVCNRAEVDLFDNTKPSGQRKCHNFVDADDFVCACGAAGDGISYVILASGNPNPDAALDRIERYLETKTGEET